MNNFLDGQGSANVDRKQVNKSVVGAFGSSHSVGPASARDSLRESTGSSDASQMMESRKRKTVNGFEDRLADNYISKKFSQNTPGFEFK